MDLFASIPGLRIETRGTQLRVRMALLLLVWTLPGGDFAAYYADAGDVAYLPIGDRVGLTAIEAGGFFETRGALRTDAAGLEGVELGCTLIATPVGSDGRRGSATRAGESLAAGDFLKLAQGAGGFEAVPAIHAGIGGDEAQPDRLLPQCQQDKTGDPNKAENRSDQQAARSSERKPEQRAQDLTAIERIDGQNVEDKEAKINLENLP